MDYGKGGLYISFEYARSADLEEAAHTRGRFSVELSNSDWHVERKEVFLISFLEESSEEKGRIHCAALARRKRGPRNTGASNVEFSEFVMFEQPLFLQTAIQNLPPDLRALIKDREGDRGKWFPPSVWFATTNFLKDACP